MAGAESSAGSETETDNELDNDEPGQETDSINVTFIPDENVPRISLRQARASKYLITYSISLSVP